jgi:hypothetical protein
MAAGADFTVPSGIAEIQKSQGPARSESCSDFMGPEVRPRLGYIGRFAAGQGEGPPRFPPGVLDGGRPIPDGIRPCVF